MIPANFNGGSHVPTHKTSIYTIQLYRIFRQIAMLFLKNDELIIYPAEFSFLYLAMLSTCPASDEVKYPSFEVHSVYAKLPSDILSLSSAAAATSSECVTIITHFPLS